MVGKQIRNIIQLGSRNATSDFDKRYIEIVNVLTLLAITVIVGFASYTGLAQNQYPRMFAQLASAVFFLFPVFIWNKLGRRLTAIYFMVVGICLATVIDANYGGRLEGHHYYFPVMAFGLCLVFKPVERKHLLICSLAPIASWILLDVTDFNVFSSIPHTADVFLGRLNLLICMLISISISTWYAHIAWKNELHAKASAKMAGLGEMSAGMAHEINNPLAIVTMATEILKRTDTSNLDKDKFDRNLQKILDASQRISTIIKSLRIFARTNSKDPLYSVKFSQIFESTFSICAHRIQALNIRVEADFDRELHVVCREAEMVQVFLNLFTNSIDALEHASDRWVSVRCREEDSYVVIEFIDSGRGIPKEINEKIMQPFFTTKQVGRGTGLGLSVCVGILQEYSGSIELDQNNMNTCFVIKIPKLEIQKQVA
jgi:signal transduction histidine kinase